MRSKQLIVLLPTTVTFITMLCLVSLSMYNVEIAFSIWTLSLLASKILFQPQFTEPPYMKKIDALLIVSVIVVGLIVLRHALDIIVLLGSE